MNLEILHRDELKLGGFAGLTEHRLVMGARAFGAYTEPGTWEGFGNFVYLADARFNPNGETRMHSHREVDVISVMVEGRIAHEGSLEHGRELKANEVQVQRAGGEGFSHNEVNPDDTQNRMIQIWVLPDQPGQAAGYKHYQLQRSKVKTVHGGPDNQAETFDNQTFIRVGLLEANQSYDCDQPFLAYLSSGEGIANGRTVKEGDLFRGDRLAFQATQNTQIIFITQ